MLTPRGGIRRQPRASSDTRAVGRDAAAVNSNSSSDSVPILLRSKDNERAADRAQRRRLRIEFERDRLNWELQLARIIAFAAVLAGAYYAIASSMSSSLDIALLLLSVITASYYGIITMSAHERRRGVLRRVRTINTVFEALLPSMVLAIIANLAGGRAALNSTVFGLYLVALAIAATRSSPRLCVYSGLTSALGYSVVHVFLILPELATPGLYAPFDRLAWIALTATIAYKGSARLGHMSRLSWNQRGRARMLESQLRRYVSPDVARAILRGDARSGEPEKRDVTVLFCDMRGFTFLCERETPEDVVQMLNAVYDGACDAVRRHGGTVNKFLGDGLLALFGAPDEHPNHASAAAEAAIEIQQLVHELRLRGGMWTHLAVGIGLDSGPVVVGSLGGSDRAEYTAIGSAVNRAARLQALAERDRRRIILSAETRDQLGNSLQVDYMGEEELKGFTEPQPIYALRYSREASTNRRLSRGSLTGK